MESFQTTLKAGCFYGKRPATRQIAKFQIFDCVEGFYNRSSLHGNLGHQSPLAFEQNISYIKN